jgi:1,2-diacylglycerol 3-alpha-glucosyltransferase
MKIIFITEYLYPQLNGIAVRCTNYIEQLKRLNHNIVVAGPCDSPFSDIKLITLPGPTNNDARTVIINTELVEYICNNYTNIDIVHIFLPLNISAPLLLPLLKILQIPVVCSHHCSPIQGHTFFKKDYNKEISNILMKLLRMSFIPFETPLCNKIMIPVKDCSYKEFFGYNIKYDIIPSGFDSKIFNTKNRTENSATSKLLVYVGRLSHEKNCDQMINYFLRLTDTEYKLLIVGDGPIRESLKKHERIEYTGYIDNNKLPEYYKKAQAFITFSNTEAFGFTLIESLACGTPIIYPKCEVFDNLYKNAFSKSRFNLDSFDEFEKCVNFTYNNNELIQQSIVFCNGKDWKCATKDLVHIYEKTITECKM